MLDSWMADKGGAMPENRQAAPVLPDFALPLGSRLALLT